MEPSHARRQREVEGSDPASAVTDDTGTEVALLRQEDNRVWILEDTGERVLYDFNLQPRDETNFAPAYLDVVYEYRLDDIDYKYSAIGASGFYNFTPCGEASPAWRPSHTPATGATWAAATCCTSSSRRRRTALRCVVSAMSTTTSRGKSSTRGRHRGSPIRRNRRHGGRG